MTDIETKARRRLNAGHGREVFGYNATRKTSGSVEAMCRLIEQHEAFRQEVSVALSVYQKADGVEERSRIWDALTRFIIAKPDPLVEALDSLGLEKADEWAPDIRKALAARGGRIVWEGE